MDFDFIVIGSGFGGSVAAHRLTGKGYRVGVMEMGCRWTPQNLPATNWRLRRWIWRPGLGLRGFFNIDPFRHVVVMHGCAVGGGSITYACTSLEPPDTIWENGTWAGLADWKGEMPRHFDAARRMLGVAENRILGPADQFLRSAAEEHGTGETFYRTRVAIFQGPEGAEPGLQYPDPYFGGAGPERASCIGCGGCMMGCRYRAKNSLDQNYLYLAEAAGAQIFAETKVVDVRPLGASPDGAEGYQVTTVPSTFLPARPRRFACRGVVFAASALGTLDLLARLKERGALAAISGQLGNRVRTNAESLIGMRVPGSRDDLSKGVAIGSGFYLDQFTHIEATRYPQGADAMGLLATVLTGGKPGRRRVLRWLWLLASSLARHPIRTARCLHPFGFARESMILLCMQTLDGHIDMRLGRPWFWPFRRVLRSYGRRIPTFIPEANDFAGKLAQAVGGTPMSMVTEILFNVPGTAHILGGCPIAASAREGVVDARHRLFGYRNAYVCDGSVIAANLGVNPSLTICALAERAMSYIPPAASASWS